MGRKSWFAVVALSMTLCLATANARATVEGENGRIAFRTYLNASHTRGGIVTVGQDGSHRHWITHPPRGVLDAEPDWSPDGRWIVFARYRQGSSAIMAVRANGEDRHRLWRCPPEGSDCGTQYLPAWSPSGDMIAFTREDDPPEDGQNLWVMRSDGTDRQQITDENARLDDMGPQWSPDGRHLVFERFDRGRQRSAVYTIRADGTDERRLTPWRMDAGEPSDWSPDGRWIIFLNRSTSDRPSTLRLVHPNGRGMHRITSSDDGTSTWLSASFSPDGRYITAARKTWDAGMPDVLILDLDGSVLRNLTRSPATWESFPDWAARH